MNNCGFGIVDCGLTIVEWRFNSANLTSATPARGRGYIQTPEAGVQKGFKI
ncbi:MAG: hypothetical protein ABSB25_08330 [Sedimentisphaerales bacterium]